MCEGRGRGRESECFYTDRWGGGMGDDFFRNNKCIALSALPRSDMYERCMIVVVNDSFR